MKRWNILHTRDNNEDIFVALLQNRSLTTQESIDSFLHPIHPQEYAAESVGIDPKQLAIAVKRIRKAITNKESIVVYCDYDVDGITGGTILWEALYTLGASVMPYVPNRETEGYGFSKKGIDAVHKQFAASLIISVDHGITAHDKVSYAKSRGIDVIVTDHHTIPEKKPDDAVAIVHTVQLSGSGVAWFLAKELLGKNNIHLNDYLGLAAMGTIADLVPLTDVNRSIAAHGLTMLHTTKRTGLQALFKQAGVEQEVIEPYHIGYIIGPRINAVGRLAHALDAVRLLCTKDASRAEKLALVLDETNRIRQQMLEESLHHAFDSVGENSSDIIVVGDTSFHQGIIGLIAGRLTERYYRPAVVLAKGDDISKASARSIKGINIISLLRKTNDLLLEVGGHPMAAGFTIKTENIPLLQEQLTQLIQQELSDELKTPELRIDTIVSLSELSLDVYHQLQQLSPFGVGNPRPVFAFHDVTVKDIRFVGKEQKHIKLIISDGTSDIVAMGFRMANAYHSLQRNQRIAVAGTIDENIWNERTSLQVKIKDIIPNDTL